MKATIYISDVIGNDEGQTSLKSVVSQYKAFDGPTSADFVIDSVGGSVEVGESIKEFIEGLSIPTTTIAKKAYSIAAHIFMAGQTRLVEDTDKVLMIHLPLLPNFTGRSSDFKSASEYLAKEEKRFTDFYASKLDLDTETIYNLLSQETFISADEAVTMGFATGKKETEFKAVAFYNEQKTEVKKMSKIEKIFNALAQELGIKTKVVALVVQDANGTEIDFVDLKEGDEIEVGAKAEVDGKPAEGEFVNTEGETWVFEGGELKEIQPDPSSPTPEQPQGDEGGEGEPEARAEEIIEVSKWEIQVIQDVFEIGTKVEYKPMEEGDDPSSVQAGEYELSDGRRVLIDSSGVIRYIFPPEGEDAQAVTVELDPEDTSREAEMVKQLTEAMEAKFDALAVQHQNEIKELKKLMGSGDVTAPQSDNQKPKKQSTNYLK